MSRLEHDWFPAALPENVSIGERSWLYSTFAFIHHRSELREAVVIGHDSGIYDGTFFELGPSGSVSIGDYTAIVGATISTNGVVRIGSYSFVAHEVTIADHWAAIPPDCGPFSPATDDVMIADNVWIGARAVILGGADIGEGSVIGASAVVYGTIPPYSIAAGNPARVVKTVRRAGDNR